MASVGGGSTKYLGLVLVVRLRVWWFYFLCYFFSLFLLFSFSPSHYLLSFVFPLPNLLSLIWISRFIGSCVFFSRLSLSRFCVCDFIRCRSLSLGYFSHHIFSELNTLCYF